MHRYSIKEIEDMTRWGTPPETTEMAKELLRETKDLSLLFSSLNEIFISVACDRSDEELIPYLNLMFRNLHDVNWPGVMNIFDRLLLFPGKMLRDAFLHAYAWALEEKEAFWFFGAWWLLLDHHELRENLPKEVVQNTQWLSEKDPRASWCVPPKGDADVGIDEIYVMLDWLSYKEKELGMRLANEIDDLSLLIMPPRQAPSWKNCACVVCGKSDDILEPYLERLLACLQDLYIPGVSLFIERLRVFSVVQLKEPFLQAYKQALEREDDLWLAGLFELLENDELKACLPEGAYEKMKACRAEYHGKALWEPDLDTKA